MAALIGIVISKWAIIHDFIPNEERKATNELVNSWNGMQARLKELSPAEDPGAKKLDRSMPGFRAKFRDFLLSCMNAAQAVDKCAKHAIVNEELGISATNYSKLAVAFISQKMRDFDPSADDPILREFIDLKESKSRQATAQLSLVFDLESEQSSFRNKLNHVALRVRRIQKADRVIFFRAGP